MVRQIRAAIIVGIIGFALYFAWIPVINDYMVTPAPTQYTGPCDKAKDPYCAAAVVMVDSPPVFPLEGLRRYRPLVLVVTIGAMAFILAPLLSKKRDA